MGHLSLLQRCHFTTHISHSILAATPALELTHEKTNTVVKSLVLSVRLSSSGGIQSSPSQLMGVISQKEKAQQCPKLKQKLRHLGWDGTGWGGVGWEEECVEPSLVKHFSMYLALMGLFVYLKSS